MGFDASDMDIPRHKDVRQIRNFHETHPEPLARQTLSRSKKGTIKKKKKKKKLEKKINF